MNGIPKSHAQDNVLDLVVETLVDAYASLSVCDPPIVRKNDLKLDILYIRKRYSEEGITFLTVTLPRLGDWLDRYVWGDKQERVAGFKPYDGNFPVFLRPFWGYLECLHADSVSEAAVITYRILRTLLHGLKKLDVPCSPVKVTERLDSFLGIESQLSWFDVIPNSKLGMAQLLIEDYLKGYDPTCNQPKHGPGAVAGGERHNEKWVFNTLFESVHAYFPYWDYIYPVRSLCKEWDGSCKVRSLQLAAHAQDYRRLRRVPEPTARLLMVPKDSRGPRIISCEPKELMYLQQGVSTHLMNFIERHPYTSGHVNFEDQSINARLALENSFSREFDTIDMADASDRVSVALIKYLFPKRVSDKWCALRSTATKLPDGRVVPLHKFAPMGSALCFPVESLVFWAIAVGTIWERTKDLALAIQSVYVYGDDIIIKNGYTLDVMNALESVALKVNRSKSFMGSHPFRESCGIEAFKGHNVTPLRVKKLPPQRPSNGTAIIAWTKYAENTQYICPRRASYELKLVESLVGPIPRVPFDQPFLCFVTKDAIWTQNEYNKPSWSAATSYWSAIVVIVKSRRHHSAISGWSRLQRNLVQRVLSGDPSEVVDRSSTLIGKKRVSITYLGA